MITPDRCYNVQAQVPIIEENNNLQSHVKLIPKNRGFKMACLNITSLHKHIDELRICLNDREVDILAINETRLEPDFPTELISTYGYNWIDRDRNRHGGGIGFYIRDTLNYRVRSDLNNTDIEVLTIEISKYKTKTATDRQTHQLRNFKNLRSYYNILIWRLNPACIQSAMTKFKFTPEMDLFASRLNKQFTNYCSCRPDPEAMYIDAFSISWKNLKFYCFPPFSCILQAVQKYKTGESNRNIGNPQLANTALVPIDSTPLSRTTTNTSSLEKPAATTSCSRRATPVGKEVRAESMLCVREQLAQLGVPPTSIDIIMASWRKGTKSQNQTYLKKWSQFCTTTNCDFFKPQISQVTVFLTHLFHSGLSYSAINSACSALSALCQSYNDTLTFGQHTLVKRFMKGVFELRPSFPRYKSVWDVNVVFNYMRKATFLLHS